MADQKKAMNDTVATIDCDANDLQRRICQALEVAANYGETDGDHHKAWVIDQMVRALLPDEQAYKTWVKECCNGEEGPETYSWSEGIAP